MNNGIIVTLIEDQPKAREDFYDEHRGEDIDDIAAKYQKYRDRFQPFWWIATSAGNGEPMARSTEKYFNRADCERAIELLFAISTRVELVRIVDGIEARSPLR